MKNLIIIIGTIILGAVIVTNFVLADNDQSLRGAAGEIVRQGNEAITSELGSAFHTIGE